MRAPLALFFLAALLQILWIVTVPFAFDWDSATYRAVALHILEGQGATTGALWNLLNPAVPLPSPADLYWMPLPSRILVPALALFPRGDQVLNALLAAGLAPLAYAFGRTLVPERPAVAIGAGLWAATGAMYARYLSIGDSVALHALLGSLGFWAMLRGRWAAATTFAVLVALTRNDGFLLGVAFSVGLLFREEDDTSVRVSKKSMYHRLFDDTWNIVSLLQVAAPAIMGLLGYLGWQLRNATLVPGWWEQRLALSRVLHLSQLIRGDLSPVGLGERLSYLAESLPPVTAMVWCLVLPFPAILRLGRLTTGAWRGVLFYWLALPLAGWILAPAIFAEGSFFRSSSALFPIACVLAVEGLFRLSDRFPRYHPSFLPMLAGIAILGLQVGIGPLGRMGKEPFLPSDCGPLATLPSGEVVFSNHPPFVETLCGRSSVILPSGLEVQAVQDLAQRYGIRAALIRGSRGPGGAPKPEQVLPGWIEVEPGFWRAP